MFKTEGFGVIGTMTDVSSKGVSDVADNGTICIDAELHVSRLQLKFYSECVVTVKISASL